MWYFLYFYTLAGLLTASCMMYMLDSAMKDNPEKYKKYEHPHKVVSLFIRSAIFWPFVICYTIYVVCTKKLPESK